MPKKIIYNGREFEFPDTATDEQIANALKEMFPTTDGGVKKKEPSQTFVGVGSKDYSPNAPVNPITANIASAKKAASTPVAPTEKVVGEFEIDVPAPTGMYETIERTSPNSKKAIDATLNDPNYRKNIKKEFEAQVDQYHANSPKRVESIDRSKVDQDPNVKAAYYDALVRDQIDLLWNVGK